MKAEIEARIAALEAELAAEREKLSNWMAQLPAELHNVTQELFDKLKAFFS